MWSSQQVSRLAICRRGLVTPLCFFDAHGNVVAGNDLAGNGFFGNDFANAGLSDRRAGTGAVFFGALGAQIARASEALGESPDGTVRPVPTALEAQSLHVDTSALTAPDLATPNPGHARPTPGPNDLFKPKTTAYQFDSSKDVGARVTPRPRLTPDGATGAG